MICVAYRNIDMVARSVGGVLCGGDVVEAVQGGQFTKLGYVLGWSREMNFVTLFGNFTQTQHSATLKTPFPIICDQPYPHHPPFLFAGGRWETWSKRIIPERLPHVLRLKNMLTTLTHHLHLF